MTVKQPLFMVIMAAMALGWAVTVAADQFPATGQTSIYRPGGDGDIQAGAPLSYKDNGDGTITDKNTHLTWEKKSDDGTIHDVNNIYMWNDAFDVHVAGLNAASFAGRNDWRVPNIKELQSIVNYQNANPSVSPEFNTNCVPNATVLTGSCTAASNCWSSTTFASFPNFAWLVNFIDGFVYGDGKFNGLHVRAVRGGSP